MGLLTHSATLRDAHIGKGPSISSSFLNRKDHKPPPSKVDGNHFLRHGVREGRKSIINRAWRIREVIKKELEKSECKTDLKSIQGTQ